MTGEKMVENFGLNYASEINASVPGFIDSEILEFLNQAYEDLIIELAANKAYSKIEKLRGKDQISSLKSDPYVSNMKKGTITFDYLWVIGAFARCTRSQLPEMTTQSWVECRDFNGKTHMLDKYTVNGLSKPVYESPLWFQNQDNICVMIDAYTESTAIMVEYIGVPARIMNDDVEPLADEVVHGKIVDRAVSLAIEAMGNPRVQTQPQISS